MKKLLLAKSVLVLFVLLAVSKSYGQIAAWDFTGIGGSSIASTAATTFNANLVTASNANHITRGAGAAWSTGNNSWRTVGFQNNGISTANTDYFQITIGTSSGFKVSLSTIDAKFAGTGTFAAAPGVTNQFAYSLNGTSFTLIGSPQVTVGTPATLTQIDLSGIAALQDVPSGTTITIRYYASGQTTTGGWGFNSPGAGQNGLAIGGTVAPSACSSADPVTGLSASYGGTQSTVSWTNGSCYDEMMVVASSSTFTGAVPSGDGSAYTANSPSFTDPSNTAFDGGTVVYKSNGNSVNVTSLTAGLTYYFKVFTRKGTTWSSGVTANTPVNYYSNASGDLDAEATWNTNTSGTGGTALSVGGFTAGNVILNIRNGNPGNINAATWTVSGTGSKIVIDGTDLTIPSTKTIAGTVDVNTGRTLKIQATTLPTFGTLATGSTIEFNQSTAFTVPNSTNYSNLTLSGAGTKSFASSTTTISGNLILDGQSSGTLTIDASAGPTFTTISLGGNLTYLGTVVNPVDVNSMTLSSTSATTQTITANGNTVRFFRIASGSAGNNIILSTTGGSSNALLGNASSGGLTINTGTTFDINGNTLTFFLGGGSLLPTTNAGTLKGSSTSSIVVNKTGTASFGTLNFAPGFSSLKDLTINHTGSTPATATVVVGTSFDLYGTLTVTAGTLALGDQNITLISSMTNTARIGNTAVTTPFTYGNGKFVLQRFVPGGKRAFRFLGHPFNSALNLNALTDNILITGGPGTGFTTSGTNSPSAFWYNPATGNESTSNDIGWTAFTTTDGTGVGTENQWKQHQGIRVLVRGSIADGLSPVSPSSVVLDAAGAVNTGTQVINVTNGTNSGYNFIANPFASNIDLTTVGSNVTIGSNLVTNYYVWDMTMGTKGGWVNPAFSSSYILPSFAGFIVKTAAADNITITENAKTGSAATGSLYRNNANTAMVRLSVTGNNINWDRFELYYDANSKIANDRNDGTKFLNSEVNLYSIQGSKNYSIDSRPFVKDDIIPLGFTSALQQTYTIKASEYSLPANMELYLRDKFLGTETKLVDGTEYTFNVTANTASQGNDRFELVQKAVPTLIVLPAATFSIKLSPNPAVDVVKVSFSNAEQAATTISITNAEGKSVKRIDAGNVQAGQLSIPVKGLAKGTYYITLSNGTERKTEKLQIQ